MSKQQGFPVVILSSVLAFFLLTSLIVSSITINTKTLVASSGGEEGGGDGDSTGEQSNGDEQQGEDPSQDGEGEEQQGDDQQQDGTEGDPIDGDLPQGEQLQKEPHVPVCSDGMVPNPETGECEEVQQEEVVANEVCDNQQDDDLDGYVDESDCVPADGQEAAPSTLSEPAPLVGQSPSWGLPQGGDPGSPGGGTEVPSFGAPSGSEGTTTTPDSSVPSFSPLTDSETRGIPDATESINQEQMMMTPTPLPPSPTQTGPGELLAPPPPPQQQPCVTPSASTSSFVDSGRLIFVADMAGMPQGPTGGSSPADPTNCPPGTNPPTTPSLTSPGATQQPPAGSTAQSPPLSSPTPLGSGASPAPSDSTQPTEQPTNQRDQPSTNDNRQSGDQSNGEGVQGNKIYKPPDSALPYRGNEIELIEFYAKPGPSVIVQIVEKGKDAFTTFADGTIKTSTIEPVPDKSPDASLPQGTALIETTKITPGAGTPLDTLGVVQVGLPTTYRDSDLVPIDPSLGILKDPITKISYEDGTRLDTMDSGRGYQLITLKDSEERDVSITYVDPYRRQTAISNADRSVTFHPENGNSYIVFPQEADGSRKVVTMTSEGVPALKVYPPNPDDEAP